MKTTTLKTTTLKTTTLKKIIGFTGPAFSGKDSASLAFKNFNSKYLSFAGPLKEACKLLFNFSDLQLHDPILKEEIDKRWNKSPRQIFQLVGTEFLRDQIDKDFFVKSMKQRIEECNDEYIIITDIRFDNEAKLITDLGGIIFEIERPNSKTTIFNKHSTENGIDKKYIYKKILNDDTIENLHLKILNILTDNS